MSSATSSRSAFTLFELLLVIILIGALYGVFISKLTAKPKTGEGVTVTIETIGDYLLPFAKESEKDVTFLCQDNCRDCGVYAGEKRLDEQSVTLFDDAPAVYRRDGLGEYLPVEFLPRKDKDGVMQNVCFRYTLFENGSRSSYIVGYNDVYYLFDAYLQPVTKYKTIEEAEAAYEKKPLIPDDERLYNF